MTAPPALPGPAPTTDQNTPPRPDPHRDIRSISRGMASGVAVLTVLADDTPRGMTVSAFAPVSFDPPLIMVAINTTGRTHDAIHRCTAGVPHLIRTGAPKVEWG